MVSQQAKGYAQIKQEMTERGNEVSKLENRVRQGDKGQRKHILIFGSKRRRKKITSKPWIW
jgi:hypothetical protein